MITYTCESTIKNQLFKTPFQNSLKKTNKWYKLSGILPWDKMATIYMSYMRKDSGRSTIDLRTVMGAMYIQHSLNLTDRQTIEMISENVYMQYFVGLSSFATNDIFDHSLLSIFRQRLGEQGGRELNEILLEYAIQKAAVKHRKTRKSSNQDKSKKSEDKATNTDTQQEEEECTTVPAKANRGTLKVDATVVPQDISYPTDTKLLNHSREISEKIIDELYDQLRTIVKVKPRTYRRQARNKWLGFSKKRKSTSKTIGKQIKTQLNYLQRNFGHIDKLLDLAIESLSVIELSEELRKKMYVISEVYRQQKLMYESKSKKVSDRIVSISQPWVRPMVRGKAGRPVEFGAKVNLSLTEKYLTVDHSSFDAFNEGKGLIEILKLFKNRFGYYPQYALVDKIYLNKENRKFMKEHGIIHNGPALGRPKTDNHKQKANRKKKSSQRNHIEGKIGQAKRKYGMDRLRTKTKASSYCAIHFIALAINMLTLINNGFYYLINAVVQSATSMHLHANKLIQLNPIYNSQIIQLNTSYGHII